jgi:hypothetical protein
MRSAPVSMLSQTTRLTGSCHREHLVCNRPNGLSLRASGMPLCCLPVPDAVGREGVAVTGSGHACHVVRRLISKYALPLKIALRAELPRSADPEIDEAGLPVGTTPRRATQLPTAWPSGCVTAKAGSTWAGPHRCGWRRH